MQNIFDSFPREINWYANLSFNIETANIVYLLMTAHSGNLLAIENLNWLTFSIIDSIIWNYNSLQRKASDPERDLNIHKVKLSVLQTVKLLITDIELELEITQLFFIVDSQEKREKKINGLDVSFSLNIHVGKTCD